MRSLRKLLGALAAALVVLAGPGGSASVQAALKAGSPQAQAAFSAGVAAAPAALRHSLNLWATIDVCSPSDQPQTVGVRGSMPGDKLASDEIYMRFRLQYADAAGTWVDLHGASSAFVKVGSAKAAHQDGWSFQLLPAARRQTTTLRGVVTFQWRRGATVLASISRPTTAGHESLAGADPPSYSAATCAIG